MLGQFVSRAEAKASHAARSAAIGLGAGIALCVGLFFWTLAAWLFLLTVTSSMVAALIIGCIYSGGGLIGFAIISSRGRKTPPAPVQRNPEPQVGLDALVAAFMKGAQAGSRVKSPPPQATDRS